MSVSAVDVRNWRAVAAILAVVLMVSCSLVACSEKKTEPTPDAVALLQAVAPADPGKLPSLQETKHWSNPYLVIRPGSVGLLTGIAANEEQILKPEDVLGALAQLPGSAWPYGRAVAILVDAKAIRAEQDKIALRRNRGVVAGELQSAHVAIHWIPSS
ncbi:MAG: hypothetical protein WBV69_00455 [Candidatus Sulfotelmatobacter sp.]